MGEQDRGHISSYNMDDESYYAQGDGGKGAQRAQGQRFGTLVGRVSVEYLGKRIEYSRETCIKSVKYDFVTLGRDVDQTPI